MRERHADWIDARQAKVFVGTYNVNGKKLEGSLQDWLNPGNKFKTAEEYPDVYAVGFQEIVDLNAMNVALDGSKAAKTSEFWTEKIQECLRNGKVNYTLVASRNLVGILLLRDVRSTSTAVGVLGMGNKGGVCVRLHIFDTSLCFVCTHLAAHRENVEGRNADYRSIMEKSTFAADQQGGSELSIPEHDCVFWLGDLNYRIDSRVTAANNLLDPDALKELEALAAHDQLKIEMAKTNGPFTGFSEGPLRFKPTYKYQPGLADTYDTRNPKKIRAPAWCDRVLWRHSRDNSRIRLLEYSCANLLPSDHKPVYGLLHVDCERIEAERENRVYWELSNLLTRYRYLPQLTLSASLFHFPMCTYMSTVEQTLTLTNTGAVLSIWQFVSKASSSSSDTNVEQKDDNSFCRRWLSVSPSSGLLLPGESVSVTFQVTIDALTAQRMNCGRGSLNDQLCLRNENGFEYFISVTVGYLRSCFGMSLEELTKTHGPGAEDPMGAEADLLGLETNATTAHPMNVPKELWRLIQVLKSTEALQSPSLFEYYMGFGGDGAYADPVELAVIREALTSGRKFPPGTVTPKGLVFAMGQFLYALPRPVIPYWHLHTQQMRSYCQKLMQQLPLLHYNAFVFIISFLRLVLSHSASNHTSPQRLGVFCDACLGGHADDHIKRQALREVFEYFLITNNL
eukprot:GSChrysophyteH1.ASY1.ANO1.1326.1 assembled CDS